jgi:hypothetical protein
MSARHLRDRGANFSVTYWKYGSSRAGGQRRDYCRISELRCTGVASRGQARAPSTWASFFAPTASVLAVVPFMTQLERERESRSAEMGGKQRSGQKLTVAARQQQQRRLGRAKFGSDGFASEPPASTTTASQPHLLCLATCNSS